MEQVQNHPGWPAGGGPDVERASRSGRTDVRHVFGVHLLQPLRPTRILQLTDNTDVPVGGNPLSVANRGAYDAREGGRSGRNNGIRSRSLPSRRGIVDRVLLAVIVTLVVLFLAVFLYASIFSGAGAAQTIQRQEYEQEYAGLLFDSLLLSHENSSGRTYQSLLTASLMALNTTIVVDGKPIDVEERFSAALNEILGDDNYYLTVKPAPLGLSVSYVLDGSPTMALAREEIKQPLLDLIDDLKDENLFGENASLNFHVYILSDDASLCSYYRNDLPAMFRDIISCTLLSGDPFYRELTFLQVDPPYRPPFPRPYHSYTSWMSNDHYFGPSAFSKSDWASGVAYASVAYRRNGLERSRTNGHVIVTVADELTTGSKADSCFTIKNSLPNDAGICTLCNSTCPYARADWVINQTAHILKANQDLFVGFHTFPAGQTSCAYEYQDATYHNIPISDYICGFTSNPLCPEFLTECKKSLQDQPPYCNAPPAAATFWCREPLCGGCTEETPGSGDFCYHQNCNSGIVDDLINLSSAAQGRVLRLEDQTQLLDVIREYASSRLSAYSFSIGTKDEQRRRFVTERVIPLSPEVAVTVTFWSYE